MHITMNIIKLNVPILILFFKANYHVIGLTFLIDSSEKR